MKNFIIGLILFISMNSFSEEINIIPNNFILNGSGIRKKIIFKVYKISLYLENKTENANEIINSDKEKIIELLFLRNISSEQITEAIFSAFKNNVSDMKIFEKRINLFRSFMPDFKKGERLVFLFEKNGNLKIFLNSKEIGQIEGKDFSQVLLSVWLGKNCTNEILKRELLGIK